MDDMLLALARDLPSTAVLLTVLYISNHHVTRMLDIAQELMTQVNALMSDCIKHGKD